MSEVELIYGDGNRIVGHACKKCGLLYTAKQHPSDHEEKAMKCCQPNSCPKCQKSMEKYRLTCFDCMRAEMHAKFAAKPESAWDGEWPVVLYGDDRYFFDEHELADYIDELEEPCELEFEACDKVNYRAFHVAEHVEWDDEHGDIPNEQEIDKHVNDWIKANVPPLYTGNGQRITSQVMKVMNAMETMS